MHRVWLFIRNNLTTVNNKFYIFLFLTKNLFSPTLKLIKNLSNYTDILSSIP